MIRRLFELVFALFILALVLQPVPGFSSDGIDSTGAAAVPAASYEELFDYFISLPEQKPDYYADVENISFQRDVANFRLGKGQLFVMPPLRDKPAVMFFAGDGHFSFTPPTKIERDQLYRYYQTDSFAEDFKFLFLIFADSTYRELGKQLTFQPCEGEGFKNELKSALDYLSDKDDRYFDTDILQTFFDMPANGLFYAHFSRDKGDPHFFEIDPLAGEEITFMRRAETSRYYKIPEVVCQFQKTEDLRNKVDLARESKDAVSISHYAIETTIKGNLGLDFSAAAEMSIRFLKPGRQWIPLRLFNELKVDSAFWMDGSPAGFFKGRKNPVLWIRTPTPSRVGEQRTLKMYYHGKLMARDQDARIYIRSSSGWYPGYGERNAATFDLTFHTPKKFPVFVSVGEKIVSEEGDEFVTSFWKVSRPVNFASFNLGDYQTYQPDNGINPRVTVMAYKDSKNIKDVAADVVNSMNLFNSIFGAYPVNNFYATETPYSHGLAFRGLIHLSSSTFYNTDAYGSDEVFRAHEVAHQWWGIEVDYATYHDKWLSEGFCDFAGLKYMQTVLKDDGGTEKYFDVLHDWRKAILGNRKYLLGSGQEAGPIWLGYRTSSSTTRGDYGLVIYKKGAWVFHMLRMMMINEKNLGDERRFTAMVRDYYNTYRGKKASTSDFRKIVEKHTGMNLDWFFNEWIYGTDIPTYVYSSKIDRLKDGRYLVRCRVRQEDVSDEFMMPVLIAVDLGKKGTFVSREFISAGENEIELLRTPEKPRKVIFNYLDSVLCEAKEEDWRH